MVSRGDENISKVLAAINDGWDETATISEKTGLTAATVRKIAKRLAAAGLIDARMARRYYPQRGRATNLFGNCGVRVVRYWRYAPVVKKHKTVEEAKELIARREFAEQVGDMVLAQNVGAELMELADKLTAKYTAAETFNEMLDGWKHGYRPTLRADVDPEIEALADLYDYVQAKRGEDVCAFRR